MGALYRFYSGRQEIFDAIAVRELEAFREEIERAFTARQLIFSPRKSLGRFSMLTSISWIAGRISASSRSATISVSGRAKASPTLGPDRAEYSAIC